MFDGIAEQEVAECEVAERECFLFCFFFLRNCSFFYLFLFNLFLLNDLINKC